MNQQEKQDLLILIEFFCARNHFCDEKSAFAKNCTDEDVTGFLSNRPVKLCSECSELAVYGLKRLDKCPYKEEKPVCSKCPVHCYASSYRLRIREVMRFSGPRIAFHSPMVAIRHLLKGLKRPKSL